MDTAPGPVVAAPGTARRVIARYRDWLPITDTDPVITLGEGNTPLVEAEKLSRQLRL